MSAAKEKDFRGLFGVQFDDLRPVARDVGNEGNVGLAFVITNYLKGFFSALFPDFSIDVR